MGSTVYEDGLGVAWDGDFVLVYFFDTPTMRHLERLDAQLGELFERDHSPWLYAQIIAPGHPLPAKDAQAEGAVLADRYRANMREMISFPMGDTFRSIVIRSVLRFVMTLSRRPQRIVDSFDELHAVVRSSATERTPTRLQIDRLAHALEVAHARAESGLYATP
jgi:hypothetical protein